MLSEACGDDVYAGGADACRGRFAACHDTFQSRLARPWAGVLDDEAGGRR